MAFRIQHCLLKIDLFKADVLFVGVLLEAVNYDHTEHPYLVGVRVHSHLVAVAPTVHCVVQHGLSSFRTVACFMFHGSSFFSKPPYAFTQKKRGIMQLLLACQ